MKRFMLIFCSLLIAFGATAQSKLGSQTPKIAKDSYIDKDTRPIGRRGFPHTRS